MNAAPVLESTQSLTLDLPPSCLQFCRRFPGCFVIGTYNLQREEGGLDEADDSAEKKTQSRNGSLLVFSLGDEPIPELSLLQTVSQPSALLDIRFNNEVKQNEDILAAVSSTGTLAVFRLDGSVKSTPLKHLATSRCVDLGEDVLYLQCKWHPVLPNVVAVTTSIGNARLLYLDEHWQISQYADLNISNTLEAWSIALSPSPTTSGSQPLNTTVYCGGDDSILRYTTCSWPAGDLAVLPEEPYSPILIRGKHDAGVTAILPLGLKIGKLGRVVITGSYDDRLRVFMIHDLHESYGARRVEQVFEENLEGGVWRLDLISQRTEEHAAHVVLLASCMHGGARVVDLSIKSEGLCSLQVLARFESHKSMNYASDFVFNGANKLICVSSSFYDKLLCTWECSLA
ncbi:hypothetical protein LLEC1_04087 [Akanthomyces lecanii]|uniref:Uncharacterized protein n=1 Tax=Cordyceps confragosa TaxID=2714763 RepID=A0A179IVP4_CORDF|nr:hypothetical protein LLEC1_04087 [Akanthomyces lecanii]